MMAEVFCVKRDVGGVTDYSAFSSAYDAQAYAEMVGSRAEVFTLAVDAPETINLKKQWMATVYNRGDKFAKYIVARDGVEDFAESIDGTAVATAYRDDIYVAMSAAENLLKCHIAEVGV